MIYITPTTEFAWPFVGDTYRFYTNVEAARVPVATEVGSWGHSVVSSTESYVDILADKRAIFEREPQRSRVLPHMLPAVWDALVFILRELTVNDPQHMHLEQHGDVFRWKNGRTGVEATFTYGDPATLPVNPMRFAAEQIEDDTFLLDERDGHLTVDAVSATFTGTWSSSFVAGMSFSDIHGPVPRMHATGMVDRTERFIMNIGSGEVFRRLNWIVSDTDQLDASLERLHTRDVHRVRRRNETGAYGELRLRIEIQHLIRLPSTQAILFLIKTQLLPFEEIRRIESWRKQLLAVLGEMPQDLADYKSFGAYRPGLLAWLGAP